MVTISLLDGYIDEPTCLGVPPYISPYPRYIAGAIWGVDHTAKIQYMTIDQIRTNKTLVDTIRASDILIIIAGMAVPGRYLSGMPISPNEVINLLKSISKPITILSGPAARYGFGLSGGKSVFPLSSIESLFDIIISGDGEIVVSELLKQHLNVENVDPSQCRLDPHSIKQFAINGARIVTQHPFYPQYLITEIETYRGCPRSITGGCSFCSEPRKGPPAFRPIDDIVQEIEALYTNGVRHFRIGNQPCIFSYMAKNAEREEFPRPNPEALEQLFKGIRAVAPELKTLHIDNANPGVLARYPDECRRIAKTIIRYHTPGDVAAFGVESVDPVVIKKNNLKATGEQVMTAISLLNDVGSARGANGLPELLPGLNFVFGLDGETKATFQLDYEFLQRVFNKDLLLRRINLRQVIPIPGTRAEHIGTKMMRKHKHEFHRFKTMVREQIEQPLLKRLVPERTILTDVYTELYDGKVTFGRQLGSYPILIGIPGLFPLHTFFNVKIVDYGYRSLTAVPYPIDINTAKRDTLEALPGIGKKRVNQIFLGRPFKDQEHFLQHFDDPDLGRKLLEFFVFNQQ
ncbi:MAG: radical SAM protein [Methanobacteriota archaeon]